MTKKLRRIVKVFLNDQFAWFSFDIIQMVVKIVTEMYKFV